MRKKNQVKPTLNLEKIVMDKVRTNEIQMKPKWHFWLGSSLMITGLISVSILAVFMTNLTLFLLKEHGPMGQWRLQQIIDSFPLWVPFLAIVSIGLGLLMLKKYDFSYKKNIWLTVLGFVVAIILTALILDYSGMDNIWKRRGPTNRLYQYNQPSRNNNLQVGYGKNHQNCN